MRKNIQTVLAAWWAGKPCKQKTCSTDGRTVYSYALPVARKATRPGGPVLVRSSGPSQTTRHQIRAVRSFVQEKGGRLGVTENLQAA